MNFTFVLLICESSAFIIIIHSVDSRKGCRKERRNEEDICEFEDRSIVGATQQGACPSFAAFHSGVRGETRSV